MASNADTVAAVLPHAALGAAASLLKTEEEMFGLHHLAFRRRLDALNQVFRETEGTGAMLSLATAEELAAAELIALGLALPSSGNKPAVLAHAIKTIAALSTVAEISGRVAGLTKEIGKQIGGGETDSANTFTADAAGGAVVQQKTFRSVSKAFDTPGAARFVGISEEQIKLWCEASGTTYTPIVTAADAADGDNKRPRLAKVT